MPGPCRQKHRRSSRRLADDFQEKALECSKTDELYRLLRRTAAALGFDYFALVHHDGIGGGGSGHIRLHNYPRGWEQELSECGLIGVDPVHHASLRTNAAFAWSELPALVLLGPRQREILARGRRFGIADGFTVPANVPGEPAGSCTFAVGPRSPVPIDRLACASQVGAHAFRAARRLHGYPVPRRPVSLSRRERQCVRLLAAGKTDWEIAAILGISVETAHHYVKRARAAYDVVSRSQLVACSLRDGLLSFDDAVPPPRPV